MWWQDLLWGIWNGLTAWIVLIAHVFGQWSEFPFYNSARAGKLVRLRLPAGGGLALPGWPGRPGSAEQAPLTTVLEPTS